MPASSSEATFRAGSFVATPVRRVPSVGARSGTGVLPLRSPANRDHSSPGAAHRHRDRADDAGCTPVSFGSSSAPWCPTCTFVVPPRSRPRYVRCPRRERRECDARVLDSAWSSLLDVVSRDRPAPGGSVSSASTATPRLRPIAAAEQGRCCERTTMVQGIGSCRLELGAHRSCRSR